MDQSAREEFSPGSVMLGIALGWQAADGVDWSRLFHAYGAATDTPGHLLALTGDDLDAQLAGFDHLDSAVLHQGAVYSVTPVAVRWLRAV